MEHPPELIDRAARAIFESESQGLCAGLEWDQLSPPFREICRKYAIAAIDAYLDALRPQANGHDPSP